MDIYFLVTVRPASVHLGIAWHTGNLLCTGRKRNMASLQHGTWSFIYKDYSTTLKDFCETYKNSFPVLAMVTQGYYGDSEMEVLGNGEAIRIHSCVSQQRVVAVDSQSRALTIPINYKLKFRIVNKFPKEKISLKSLILQRGLPVDVEICDEREHTFSLKRSQQNLQTLGTLTLKDIYVETYFLANAIVKGKPQYPAMLIPLYLKDIMVARITGVQGYTTLHWKEYQNYLHTWCDDTCVPPDTDLMEMAIYPGKAAATEDNIYQNVEPSNYIVATLSVKMGPGTLPKPAVKPKPSLIHSLSIPPPLPERNPTVRHGQQRRHSETSNHVYVNEKGRATVKPFAHLANEAAGKALTKCESFDEGQCKSPVQDRRRGEDGSKSSSQYHSERKFSLPVEVENLTIDGLADKMKDLKLDKYIPVFKEHAVDGYLAMSLNESILKEDFNFTGFDALKFMTFVNTAHVPL